ncbi:hypothetical protein [Grimontia sp. NTOU-MAR1]|uniref:hypothetical protein n=1 Tax=Grimontia sp. NTOU-MAR1 TaxID=3111011 RepID=UPI002DBA869E|nr:hypothetical protein [Grimontia sp. NTOU-MAR1]WRW01047.1 hypothetical protein VP504_21630 [Grimontia sp. NTOU-MAR1]
MRDVVLKNLCERFQSLNEIVDTLNPELFTTHLNVPKNKSVGEHMWCIVGARESYTKSLLKGEWAGFECSLASTECRGDVIEKLKSSEVAFDEVVNTISHWTPERDELLVYLLEHEATHEAQLIRHIFALEQTLPESVKWA